MLDGDEHKHFHMAEFSRKRVTEAALADRHISGVGELFRKESSQHTPPAWLRCAEAVLVDAMLVIALPGSIRAVAHGMDILAPILAHALDMAAGDNHA